METDNVLTNTEDEKKLYRKARRRVHMKIHFAVFVLVNVLLWLLYYFLFRASSLESSVFNFFLALSLIWGIIVLTHYLIVFKWGSSYVEKEAKRMQEKQKKQEEIQDNDNTEEN